LTVVLTGILSNVMVVAVHTGKARRIEVAGTGMAGKESFLGHEESV
jgi:hypothetical protein